MLTPDIHNFYTRARDLFKEKLHCIQETMNELFFWRKIWNTQIFTQQQKW